MQLLVKKGLYKNMKNTFKFFSELNKIEESKKHAQSRTKMCFMMLKNIAKLG